MSNDSRLRELERRSLNGDERNDLAEKYCQEITQYIRSGVLNGTFH